MAKAFPTTFKTAVFRLHNPSNHRRAMMLDAMKRAHRAYSKALCVVEPDVRMLAGKDEKETKAGLHEVGRKVQKIVRPLPIALGAKDGVTEDVAAAASSFLELVAADPATSYPAAGRLSDQPAAYGVALTGIAAATIEGAERELRDLLATAERPGHPRPMTFVRVRKADGFLLLRDAKGRLFAWLNLHTPDSRFAEPVNVVDMIDVRTGELVSFRSVTGELFPLELSADFQAARFMVKGQPKSARLFEREGAFYLAVAFAFEAEARTPVNVLGVDRGIENVAAWSVVSPAGELLARGRFEGAELRELQRRAEAKRRDMQRRGRIAAGRMEQAVNDTIAHTVANLLVDAADRWNARVVLEDLSPLANGPQHRRIKGKRRSRGFNRLLSRAVYQKVERALAYKLPLAGLPAPGHVRARDTSNTCPRCGHSARGNRPEQAVFRCVQCGHQDHADDNASTVIALKGLWWSKVRGQAVKGQRLPDELSFGRFLQDMAAQAAMAGEGCHAAA